MSAKPITKNTLFYGDNLDILREYILDESVDLVYLDPPFNSQRTYNVLFKYESGDESEAQIAAFEDTWHWNMAAAKTYHELIIQSPDNVSRMITALHDFIRPSQMLAYLVMMAARLVELHRVLKPTGSLYLHCDPTASHYLKIILDTIFGPENFQTEIVWKRSSAHSDTKQGAKQPGRIHDTLFFYTKGKVWTWNPVYVPYDLEYIASNYRYIENETGRKFKSTDLTAAKPGGDTLYEWKGKTPPPGRYWAYSKENMQQFEDEGRIYYTSTGTPRLKQYLDEMPGVHIQDIWVDIPPISSQAKERLGYPTQKPLELLERIIKASSNPGDIVLDPFCGCGTTVAASQKLGRKWIGIDITHLAIALQRYRLQEMFPGTDFEVIGEPLSVQSARHLAEEDRFQFEWWALSLVKARPSGGQAGSRKGKKGADRGIDGIITFIDEADGKPKRILVQIKSGGASSKDIRDLVGTVRREKAAIGVLITLEAPTRPMITEAASAGFYHSPGWGQDYPKIQILTIEELLAGKEIKQPPSNITFKKAERVKETGSQQMGLFDN